MALVRVSSYTKNVAKSFGYVLQDMANDYAPNISSMMKETKETSKELYQSIKDWSTPNGGSLSARQMKGTAKSAVNTIWKNLVDDVKTGQWYNKSRQEAFENGIMSGMFGGDFSFDDIDFDSDDWGDDDDFEDNGWDEKDTAKVVKSETQKSTAQLSMKMDQVGFNVSKAVNQGTIQSANYIVEANNANSRAIFKLTESGFSTVTKALMNVNNSVNSFAQLGQPLTVHMQNSAQFYTNTTQQLNNINEGIQKLVANTTTNEAGGRKKSGGTTYDDIFMNGKLDINAWKNMIKENFSNDKDMLEMATNMLKGIDPKNISVGALLTRGMTHMVIPKILKDSVKGLDETVKYAIHDLMFKGKAKLEDKGFLGTILSQYIFPDTTAKQNINTSNYEKGRVAWDGIARRALTYVVPVYLSKIYSALSGADETIYDYNRGVFVKMKSVRGMANKRNQRYVEQAGGDFRKAAQAEAQKLSGRYSQKKGQPLKQTDVDKIMKEIDNYILDCINSNEDINFLDYYNNFKNSKYRNNEYIEEIKEIFDIVKSNYRSAGLGYKVYGMNSNIMTARMNRNAELKNIEQEGSSIENILTDGTVSLNKKYKPGASYSIKDLFMPDKHKNTLMDYMYGIYNILAQGGGRGRRGKGPKGPVGPIDSAKYDEFQAALEAGDIEEANAAKNRFIGADGREYDYSGTGGIEYGKDLVSQWLEKHKLGGLVNSGPFNALAGMVTTMSNTITEIVWGKDGEPDKGLFGNFAKKMNEFFDKLKNKFDDVWKKVANKLFGEKDEDGNFKGGVLSAFINDTKDNLHQAGKWGKNVFGEALYGKEGWQAKNAEGETKPENDNAANGRRVTKTGMVAVSEGELIIPAELNPFYNKPVNKQKQYRDEANAVKNYYGSYADGGSPFDNGIIGIFKGLFSSGKEKVSDIISNIFGKKDDIDKSKSIMNDTLKTVFGEAKENSGAMGAGALIGGGVSLLTGAVVGPLFGAAIGAGAGLIIKSEKVQNLLFGDFEVDDEGNKTDTRKGGLLNKELSNFMTKNIPSMAKGGLIGGAAGLFMGSPFLGAIVGAGIGFISSSESAQSFLFGDKDNDNGLISKELQEKVKSAVPGIAAGAIAGLVAGPFGIAGNLIFGAGLGYLASSEEFKKKLFGDKENGDEGLFGSLKTKIVNPLSELAINTTKRVTNWLTRLGKDLSRRLFNGVKGILNLGKKAFDKIAGNTKIGGAIKGIGSAVIGGASNFLTNRASKSAIKNAKAGVSVYDATKGGNLSASEVLSMMDRKGAKISDEQRSVYESLAGIDDAGQIKAIQDAARQLDRAKYLKKDLTQDQLDEFKKTKGLEFLFDENGEYKEGILNKINTTSLRELAGNEKSRFNPENANKEYQKDVRKKLGIMSKTLHGIAAGLSAWSKGGSFGEAFSSVKEHINDDRGETTIVDKITNINDAAEDALREANGVGMADGGIQGQNESNGFLKQLLAQTRAIFQKLVLGHVDESTMSEAGGKTVSGNETSTQLTALGDTVEVTANGEPDPTSTQTKNAFSFRDKFKNAIFQLPIIGGALSGISGLLGSFKEKLFGDGEKKPGLFDKLLGLLSGTFEGPLSWLTNLFTGRALGGGIAKGIMKALSWETILPVLGVALGGAALSGKFDGLFQSFAKFLPGATNPDGSNNAADNRTVQATTADGQNVSLKVGSDGLPIKNNNGEYLTTDDKWISLSEESLKNIESGNFQTLGSDTRLSTKLKENLARGIIKGNPKNSIAGAMMLPGLAKIGKGTVALGKSAEVGISGLAGSLGTIGKYATSSIDDIAAMEAERITKKGLAKGMTQEAAERMGKRTSENILKKGIRDKSIVRAAKEAGTEAAEKAIKNSKVVAGVSGALDKLADVFRKLPFGANLVNGVDAIKDAILPTVAKNADNVAETGAKTAAKGGFKLASLFTIGPIDIAMAAADALNGWTDAASILGILDKPTIGQRTLAAVVAAINSLIPLVGNLIPNKALINILIGIAPKLGIDVSELEQQRASAAEIAKEKGMTVEQINDANGNGGLYRKIANSKTANKIKTGFKKAGQGIKDFIKDPKATLENIGEKAKEGLATAKEKLGEGAKAAGQKINEVTGIADLVGFVKSGDLKGYMSFEPDSVGDDENPAMRIVKNVPTAIIKHALIGPMMISFAGHKIADTFNAIKEKVTNGFKFVQDQISYGANFFDKNNDAKFSEYMKVEDPDPENPMGGLAKAAVVGMRLVGVTSVIVKFIGKKVKEKFDEIVEKVKATFQQFGQSSATLIDHVKDGEPGQLMLSGTPLGEDTPVGPIMNGVLAVEKHFLFIPSVISWAGHKLWNGIQAIGEKIKGGFEETKTRSEELFGLVSSGASPIDVLSYGTPLSDPENVAGPFMNAILAVEKKFLFIPSVISWVGHGIKNKFDEIKGKIDNQVSEMDNVISNIQTASDSGSITSLWNVDTGTDDEGNPLGFMGKAIGFVSKIIYTPGTLINGLGIKIKGFFDSVTSKITEDDNKLDEEVENLEALANKGKVGEVIKYQSPTFNSMISGIYSFRFGISRIINIVTAGFHKLLGPVDDLFSKIKDVVGWGDDDDDSASGSGIYSGGSSGVVSQLDPRYANIPLGNSTVGAKGCGPAVASMIAQDQGKNLSMNQAINASRKYQNANGTEISYFDDVLSQQGIQTKSISKDQILPMLSGAGSEIILAGQDPTNRSKANSPFGPNPHYVIATGRDAGGNIVVKDPENNRIMTYDPSILKNVQYSLAAGGAFSGVTDNHQKIWGFLKSKGLNEYAIAGLMGCWQEESSNTPDTLEGNYALKSDSNTVMGSASQANEYTQRLFSMYANNGLSINKNAYKGTDGNYYPGYGLAQWTGPRQYALVQWAKQNGMDHRKLDTQLQFFWSEYQNKPALKQALSSANDLSSGTIAALDNYEMSAGWHNSSRGQKQLATRLGHAQGIYKALTGTDGVVGNDTGSAVDISSTDGSISGQSAQQDDGKLTLGNILSKVSEAFGKIGGSMSGSDSSSSSSSYGSDSTGSATTVNGDAISSLSGNSPSDIMKSILGQISYSMSGARNPEAGSADCSSTVQWAIKKAGGPDIGGNTGAQYNNPNLTPVVYNGGNPITQIPDTAQKDDVMFFARHGSSDKGAALDHVGHVGLYLGNNQYIDHGSGMGPQIKNGPGTELIKISRITGSAAGSGLVNYNRASQALNNYKAPRYAAAGSGLTGIRYYGGDSGVVNTVSNAATFTSTVNSGGYTVPTAIPGNTINAELLKLLFESITTILKNVSDNTVPVREILALLQQYLPGRSISEEDAAKIANSAASTTAAVVNNTNNNNSADVSDTFRSFVNQLADIAKG